MVWRDDSAAVDDVVKISVKNINVPRENAVLSYLDIINAIDPKPRLKRGTVANSQTRGAFVRTKYCNSTTFTEGNSIAEIDVRVLVRREGDASGN